MAQRMTVNQHSCLWEVDHLPQSTNGKDLTKREIYQLYTESNNEGGKLNMQKEIRGTREERVI